MTLRAGDGNRITVNNYVYALAENPKIKEAVAGVLAPLKEEGIDKVEFRGPVRDGEPQPVVTFSKSDAEEIRASCELPAPALEDAGKETALEPQTVTAHLRVYSPVFDPKAERWRFKYGEEPIPIDITGTTIARDAVDRGFVTIGDLYKVKLAITEHETPTGQFRKSYKIVEVLEFRPATRQADLFTALPLRPEEPTALPKPDDPADLP